MILPIETVTNGLEIDDKDLISEFYEFSHNTYETNLNVETLKAKEIEDVIDKVVNEAKENLDAVEKKEKKNRLFV